MSAPLRHGIALGWIGCLLTGQSSLAAPAGDELSRGVRTTEPVPASEQVRQFQLPPGFEIQLVASEPEIQKPFNLAFDAIGRLWVTTSVEYPWAAPTNRPGRDRLTILEDFGPDGRARKVTQFADGLNIPIGVYPFRTDDSHWKAIVWSIPYLWLLEDTDGDGQADKRTPLYGPFDHTRDTHGNQASFRRGFDGWLYCTHGFNNDSHVTARDGSHVDLNSGNTYRIRLDGSRIEHHTHGQVNPFGLSWDARGNLYSSDCHSAPIYQLLAGGWYPSFGKPHDGLGFAPVMLEHAHGSTAIDGALYYNDDLWPEEFQDTFFIGNVMTSRLNRDKITFTGSTPKATEQPDFLTSADPWFRPVDTTLGPDGALYIADFYNRIIGHYEVPLKHPGRDRERGRLWRVVYKGEDGKAKLRNPALAQDLDGLIAELGSPNLTRRLGAMAEIQDRFGSGAVLNARMALTATTNSQQRIHLLWLLDRLGAVADPELNANAKHPDSLVRVHVQRIISERGRQRAINPLREGDRLLPVSLTNTVFNALTDPDALVRRCAAEALGNWPAFDDLRPLLDALVKADPADTHLVYVLRKALRDHLAHGDLLSAVLARNDWSDADLAALADVALAVKSPEAGAFVIRNLDHIAADPARLAPAIEHAARHAPEADLARVAAHARTKFSNDLNFRIHLFNWMQSGLASRGLDLPPDLKSWGAELAQQALDSLDANSLGWTSAPLAESRNMVPWNKEPRTASDGSALQALSSLPPNESFTGVLRSPVFAAPKQLSFWLCGHDGPPDQPALGKNRVRLLPAPEHGRGDAGAAPAPIAESAPPRNDVARKITWDLSAVEGRPVYLEVTDGDTGNAYAWLALGPFDPPVLTLPAVPPVEVSQRRTMAADLTGKLHLTSLAPSLRQVLEDSAAGLPDRVAAARALAAIEPEPTARKLADILDDGTQPAAVRDDLGSALAGIPSDVARAAVVNAMKTAPARTQARWAGELASRPDGAGALVKGVQEGLVPARLLQTPALWNALKASLTPESLAQAEAFTRDLPPPDEAREKLLAARRSAYASADARADEGRRVFEANCLACHQLEGKGGLVGPQLTGIGNRGIERLCEDILDPNRNVDHAFRQTLIVLKDGETRSGLFRREDGGQLIFVDAAGQEFAVATADVAERREVDQSLMPENFGDIIPESEFPHLLAFLLSQRGSQ
ncbi:MAG: c-type cytochrome [Verrucomicrobiae bacterium]|nr:c-type cytochrome [Verrucomicrobiae bacterium]